VTVMGITYLDYYVPEIAIPLYDCLQKHNISLREWGLHSADEYAAFCEEQMLLTNLREEQRFRDVEMLQLLLERAMEQNIFKPFDIDVIILAQEPMNYQTDNIAHYLQYKLHMKRSIVFHVTGNHCCNVEMSLKVARDAFIANPEYKKMIIMTVTKINDPSVRFLGKQAILSDGAGIVLVERDTSKLSYVGSRTKTNGYFHDPKVIHNNSFMLHYKSSVELLSEIRESYELESNEIQTILLQNTTPRTYYSYLEKAGLDTQKVFGENFGKYGHITSADFVINLKDALAQKNYAKGDKILSFGMGWAGNYHTVLLSI